MLNRIRKAHQQARKSLVDQRRENMKGPPAGNGTMKDPPAGNKTVKGPPAGTEALPASRIQLVLGSIWAIRGCTFDGTARGYIKNKSH